MYHSTLVSRFISNLMREGKKAVAQRILYDAFKIIEEKLKKPPLEVFNKAIDNVKPELEVKSRRVGGATYQVPVEVRPERRIALAIRWIINFAKGRHGKSMSEKLAEELIDAYNNTGTSIKKMEDTRKMAEANKAFAHYKW
ncbi:MAG: 30S ribosomal protein S7 [Spirochaetes bacterium DG_61]|jgi:small subunit ribosomal protein S7|nr:MAG: 30S ribosomal protein S7 [Spirochaetes bacterium DG_61]